MSILTAISRGCKGTMVDGSVRYTIEFGPLEAVAAATLFGMPGTEMGVVALKDGRDHTEDVLDIAGGTISDLAEQLTAIGRSVLCSAKIGSSPNGAALPMASDQVADTGKTKHITLANYAGIFCNDPVFWEWIGTKTDKPKNAEEAAGYIRRRCVVTSRAQIDHSKDAAEKFRQIMREFNEWGQK